MTILSRVLIKTLLWSASQVSKAATTIYSAVSTTQMSHLAVTSSINFSTILWTYVRDIKMSSARLGFCDKIGFYFRYYRFHFAPSFFVMSIKCSDFACLFSSLLCGRLFSLLELALVPIEPWDRLLLRASKFYTCSAPVGLGSAYEVLLVFNYVSL